MFLYIRSKENSSMPVCLFFYHTDLQQKLFLLALLTPIILQFSQFCKTNCAHSISKTIKHALPLSKNLQNWPHYKTFSWREFSVIPGLFSRKNLFLCNKQDSNYGLSVKTIKKFPKSPIRPAGLVVTFVKHQTCSPNCRSRLNEH